MLHGQQNTKFPRSYFLQFCEGAKNSLKKFQSYKRHLASIYADGTVVLKSILNYYGVRGC